jgi:hypothetical protein
MSFFAFRVVNCFLLAKRRSGEHEGSRECGCSIDGRFISEKPPLVIELARISHRRLLESKKRRGR